MPPHTDLLWKLFIAALAVRWTYDLTLFATMGSGGLAFEDSHFYMQRAQEFAQAITSGSIAGLQWVGPDPWLMPLFHWFMTLLVLLFGELMPLAYVLLQGGIDASTCLIIYGIAREIAPDYARPAALCAIFNPTQIVAAGLVANDTPFTFFIALSCLGQAQWLKAGSTRAAVLIAAGLGGAMLFRMVAAPWAAMVVLALLAASLIRQRLIGREAIRLLGIALFAAACFGVVVGRNGALFGVWSPTSQSGEHLALWVVPLAKEARDRTPRSDTEALIERRRQERFGGPSADPFERSRQYHAIGREALDEIGTVPLAKAWLLGAAINLSTPAILLSPPIYLMPRTRYSQTTGETMFDKLIQFFFHTGAPLYTGCLMIGLVGVVIIRLVQLTGISAIVRSGIDPVLLGLFAAWFAYILLITGPVTSPRYRLPLEPLFMVAAGAGLQAIRRRRPAALPHQT